MTYLVAILTFAQLFGAWTVLPTPHAEAAAYQGKRLRTVEYALGGGAGTGNTQTGTDNQLSTGRASDLNVYAGTSWNSTKGSAGTKTIAIPGTGIHVLSAYLDMTVTPMTNTDITDLEVALDVTPGPAPGIDVGVSPVSRDGTGLLYTQSSGDSVLIQPKADVTALFQNQTDAQFNTGLAVVGMLSVTGPTWINSTMKLIVTYEEDYSTTPHTELKTVRFPLRSTAAGDQGTRRADCVATATCSLTYTLDLPDLAVNTDIVDAFFEISYVEDGSASTTISINGGSAGAEHNPKEVVTDGAERFLIYRPAIGAPNFATTTSQLDILVASSSAATIGGLGGEVVVTYKYSTGAPTQMETVSYFMGQQTALPGTASSSYTNAATISNAGANPSNIWFRVHDSVTNTPNLYIETKVGSSATTTVSYTPTLANSRSGELRIIQDVSTATTSWSGASSVLGIGVRHAANTYDGPPGVEAMITFRWSGSGGGTVTQTGKFFAGTTGSTMANANEYATIPFSITLPETVTKTLRSSYLSTAVMHTNTGTISAGVLSILLSGSTTATITEGTEDTEAFHAIYVTLATSTNFNLGSTIPFNTIALSETLKSTVGNEHALSSEMVVTYDAALILGIEQKHYRFRADDGTETSSTYVAAEDTTLDSAIYLGDGIRLRTLFANTGVSTSTNFTLEYASSSCTFWLPVATASGLTTEEWVMRLTGNVANGASTTDSSGLTNPSSSIFSANYVRSVENKTGNFSLSTSRFTEQEWSIRSTLTATTGLTYCFRVSNNGATTNITYTATPQLILNRADKPIGGGSNTEGSGSGNQQGGSNNQGGGGGVEPDPGGGQGGGGAGGGGGGGDSG